MISFLYGFDFYYGIIVGFFLSYIFFVEVKRKLNKKNILDFLKSIKEKEYFKKEKNLFSNFEENEF